MNNLLEKDTVKRVEFFLKKFNPNLKIIILKKTARTARDAASSLKCNLGAIIKSLVFKSNGDFVICLVSGDKKCSLNKLKKILFKKNLSMANADEVKKITGFSIGGVAPVAHLKKLNIFIDKSLKRFDFVYVAAVQTDCVFKISYNDLVKMTNGLEQEIIE